MTVRLSIARLHFVYNVEATPRALIKDFVHRLTDPATYPCRLCDITYGRFVKKPGWQKFLRSLPVRSRFYTKDRFRKKYPHLPRHDFPVVLAEDGSGSFSVFLSSREFIAIPTLEALESEVSTRLKHATRRARKRGH